MPVRPKTVVQFAVRKEIETKMRYPTSKYIEQIWSDENTVRLAEEIWLAMVEAKKTAGWVESDRRGAMALPKNDHEVIDMLHTFINRTGLVNAHAGMTSSDVIDNVRLSQVAQSNEVIEDLQYKVLHSIESKNPPECKGVGYTHWQVASPIGMQTRLGYWSQIIGRIDIPIAIRQKRIGGAVGTGDALEMLTGHQINPDIVYGLISPLEYTIQSSDHLDELESAQALDRLAAVAYKICADIRFLCAMGEVSIAKDPEYKGSSAMPGKQNPQEAERICGLARLQPSYSREIWDALSNNGMERTLDNSSTLRIALPDMYYNIATILIGLESIISKLQFDEERIERNLEENKDRAYAEDRLAQLIKDGMSWPEAYEKVKNK